MRPPPPSTLSKEFSRVWVGWCAIGDREVAREAAAKGIYISLALQFIATRKEWDHSDVERWFRSEILTWVYQLLERRQIFKASHILSNIGVDATEQFSDILSETTNKDLRNYIGEHLFKNEKLDPALLNSWKFVQALENSSHIIANNLYDDISQISIIKIDQKSKEWKTNLATVLFFNTYDFYLETFLSPDSAWINLLTNEKLDILKIWINVYFTKDINYNFKISLSSEICQKLKNLFLFWEITNAMINQVKNESYSAFVKDFVLNELSCFGIYSDDEKNNIPMILSRISKTQNIHNINKILEEPTSHLSITDFYEKLNYFCVKHELYEVLGICSTDCNIPSSLEQNVNSKQLALWLKKKEIPEGGTTENALCENILTALYYFADSDIHSYLNKNPIILLAVIIFTKDINLHDIISNQKSLEFDNVNIQSEKVIEYLNPLPVMRNVLTKFTTNVQDLNINLYTLLESHTNLLSLYEFRTMEPNEIPHFGNTILCNKYGYSNNVNYLYYVKQNRPGKAAKIFILDQFKNHGRLTKSGQKDALHKTTKLAFKSCTRFDIMSSCISFLEMIGNSTIDLRVLVNSVKIIYSTKIFDETDIQRLYSDIPNNSKVILQILEKALLEKCDLSLLQNNFNEIIKNYEISLKFASINNLELPENFLLHCAKNNLWLQFIIFIQMYNYPLEQSLRLALNFENKEIMEHIYHSLSNNTELNFDKNLISSTDRLSASMTGVEFETFNNFLSDLTPRTNLLKVLLKCHKSVDPPTALLHACQSYKNPLLAILATCYEPDSVVTNWLTWLSVSTEIQIDVVENYSISASSVSSFLEKVLHNKYVRTLLDSFKIFLPDNPLHHIVEFLHQCVRLNFESSINDLNLFEKSVKQLNFNTVMPPNDFEYTYLNNSYWLIDTAIKLIFATLGNCFETKLHQITFLNTLCLADFTKNVPIECPNFCSISQMLESLSSLDIELNLSVFYNKDKRVSEIIRCIEIFVGKHQFKDALHLAKYENICKEYVLNEEWSSKLKQQGNNGFWTGCEEAFKSANIIPSSAAEFFVYCCKNIIDCSEKYQALKLAYKWLKQCDYSDQFVENIEQEIWSNYFALDDATLRESHYDKHETNYLLSEIQERSNTNSRFDHKLDSEQLRHLEETIGKILESGDIIEALRLEKMFDHKDPEIAILLTCYELAESKLRPYEISAEQRLLFLNRDMNLKSVPHRRRAVKSTRASNLSSGSFESTQTMVPIVESEESTFHDTLALLETMTDRLKHGSNIASRILMCYRISVNVNVPYQDIVKHSDSVSLLKTALEKNCRNKLEVVHDIFVIYRWSKSEITDFIFEELKRVIYTSINLNLECVIMWDLDLDTKFHLILQLCSENNSILGKKIISFTNTIQEAYVQSKTTIDDNQMSIVIEFLIRAHDCYNTYCNMEGIASVLRKAQSITSILLNLKNWKLMVRLLTGIGRYTEMNYIFQILNENDQFEYLLKKHFRKDNKLKMALLKFLNKHCPKNQDLYRIVALHFYLYSEVANLWENEAVEMIDNLIEIAKLEVQNQGRNVDNENVLFTKNDSTNLCLTKVMTNYTHAAEYHLLGDKLTSAIQAARHAELLALQLAMLKSLPANGTAKCILKLSATQILALLTTDLSFPQAKIVSEAYNYQVDWGAVLFQQCVINAKTDYLESYFACKPLTNTLAQDLTRRFLAEKVTFQMSVKAMKEILKKLESVQMKYRLASELGFSDVIETLLSGSQLAYLKDTVWKKGYKQM